MARRRRRPHLIAVIRDALYVIVIENGRAKLLRRIGRYENGLWIVAGLPCVAVWPEGDHIVCRFENGNEMPIAVY